MKIIHANDCGKHMVQISFEGGLGPSKTLVSVSGYGRTKHDAIKEAVSALNDAEARFKECRDNLNSL